jgi:beta-xylosidase
LDALEERNSARRSSSLEATIMKTWGAALLGLLAGASSLVRAQAVSNSTFFNPVLPGWHSDPSCIRVEDIFYCVASTFIAFPGLPVYASKDLVNWKLISHVWSRESQLPGVSWNTTIQQDGLWAPTIRYHDNEFWVVCEYILNGATLQDLGPGSLGVLFRAEDPYSDEAWGDPLIFHPNKIDPDIFFLEGKVFVATQGIVLQELDIETGELSQPAIPLWNGTGGVWPEGPHLYKKDGWFYLLIAEGGTAQNHAVTIARSRNITGPYEANAANPILTNRNTDAYFTRVGHGDIFDDTNGNWWVIVHASRSGVAYDNMPMGRESVLAPARWDEGEWPVVDPVRGELDVWPLPAETRDLPGEGTYFNGDPDVTDWDASSAMPKHFVYWRVPRYEDFAFTDRGLEIKPSRSNLTGAYNGDIALTGQRGISFVSRRQTQTIFNFSVDVSLDATEVGQEAGVTAFLAQENHAEIALAYIKPCGSGSDGEAGLHLRFRAHGRLSPPQVTFRLPDEWLTAAGGAVRLHIQAPDQETFVFGASPLGEDGAAAGDMLELGTVPAELISHLDSAKSGTFIGALIGVYATCNGAGEGVDCPDGGIGTFQRWRYEPVAQFIDYEVSVPV